MGTRVVLPHDSVDYTVMTYAHSLGPKAESTVLCLNLSKVKLSKM